MLIFNNRNTEHCFSPTCQYNYSRRVREANKNVGRIRAQILIYPGCQERKSKINESNELNALLLIRVMDIEQLKINK